MADNKVKFLRGTSAEYESSIKDNDIFYYTTDTEKLYLGNKEITGGSVTIDDTLSDTSENPVQNKVVKQAIDNKADKTVATTDTDGLMSAEDKGKLDSVDDIYALKSKYGDTTINVGRKTETDVGEYSTAEGCETTASGNSSHAEGDNTIASGPNSHAEGTSTIANKISSHAEGFHTTASGTASHAEGYHTTASGSYSHAEGYNTTASGDLSHTEGFFTTASGAYSHTEGYRTIANNRTEHASGQFNQSNSDTLFSVGDGTAEDARHNAFEITATGGKLHDKDIATTDLIPTSVPASGGNADTVNNHTVESDVPADAVFTDTIYNLPTAGLNTLGGVTTTSTVSSSSGHTACPIIEGVPYYRNILPYQGNTDVNGEYRLLLSYQTNDESYQEYYLRKSGKFTANPSTGTLKASSVIVSESTDYTTPKCRNCTMSTSSASGGNNGDIHFQYS